MALGDSITAGVGARGADVGGGGYRGELERLLESDGYNVRLIGSRSDFFAADALSRPRGVAGIRDPARCPRTPVTNFSATSRAGPCVRAIPTSCS